MIEKFTAFALFLAASTVSAEAQTLKCNFEEDRQIVADLDPDSGTAVVRLVGEEDSKRVANISEDSKARLVLAWQELQADRRGTYAKLSVRLVHFKKNNKGLLKTDVIGFTNQYFERGRCQQR